MGYADKERIQVKKEFLRMMVRMKLNPAKERLIYGFFEKYLTLNQEEEAILMEEIKGMENAEKIMEIPISYEEKGKELGIKKVALEMLRKGSTIEFIADVTHLDRSEIEKLKRSI